MALLVNRKLQENPSTYGTTKGQEFLDEHDDFCLKFYPFWNGKYSWLCVKYFFTSVIGHVRYITC